MSAVYLTTAGAPDAPVSRFEYKRVSTCASRDRFGVHQRVDDPAAADVVVFAELGDCAGPLLERVRRHDLYRDDPERCFIFAPRYKGIPLVPGIYASIPSHMHHRERTRSSHYTDVSLDERIHRLPPLSGDQAAPLLFSFVGSVWTAPVREALGRVSHPRGYFEDTTDRSERLKAGGSDAEWAAYRRDFVETCEQSAFVLCPRGIGPATLRLFETMKMGRAPVILADAWHRPVGPDWDAFSITIPEADVDRLPEILEAREADAAAMGRRARAAYDDWFSDEATFHRVVEWCYDIRRSRRRSERVLSIPSRLRALSPRYLKRSVLYSLNRMRG
jgi:hypothetical protein